jgi:hypothetical protein
LLKESFDGAADVLRFRGASWARNGTQPARQTELPGDSLFWFAADVNQFEPLPQSGDDSMNQKEKAKAFLIPKFRQLFHFFAKQGLAVAGNLLYGLLCVRMLPMADYAKFAVLFGFMGSLTMLLDAGVASTLTPMVGERIHDMELISNCVASIRRIAFLTYLVVAPIAAVCFILLVHRQHWPVLVVAEMLAVLLVTAWFGRVTANYGLTLVMLRDRGYYYRIQIMGSLGSLGLLVLAMVTHHFNIYVGILLNVAQVIFNATGNFRRVRKLLGTGGRALPHLQKAILRLATPNFPGTLFYSVQGQITLMLIVIFGRTNGVASIGALGRLSQVFVIFTQMNLILVEPFFAKLPAARVKKFYLLAILGVGGCCAVFSGVVFRFPDVFLWLLGPKYYNLQLEAGLVILGGACTYMYGFMWIIHTSRRFVYWWTTAANITMILLVEVFFIVNYDLSSVRTVLKMNIATGLASLLVAVACGIYGFWHGPRTIEMHPSGQ